MDLIIHMVGSSNKWVPKMATDSCKAVSNSMFTSEFRYEGFKNIPPFLMVNDLLRPTAHWKKILATLEDSSWFINDKSQQPALNPRDVSTEPGWPVHAAVPATVDLAAVWPRSKETQVVSPTGKVVGKCGRDLILNQCHVCMCVRCAKQMEKHTSNAKLKLH